MRLAFAGTPSTAVPSLRALLDSPRHDIAAVITRPHARAGRGRPEVTSPVETVAVAAGVPVLAPRKAGDPDFRAQLAELQVDCCAVVAYGALLPTAALAIPAHGWVNLHFSLLPAWRGAAPVQRAILAGDDITGASTFQIEVALDTGPVYGVVTERIRPSDTAGDLLARLAESGAGLLVATMDGIADGTLVPRPQSGDGVSLAPKITVDDARVDWSAPGRYVDRQVRACTPAPGAWTTFRGERLKLGPVSSLDGSVRSATSDCPRAPGALSILSEAVAVDTSTGPVRLGWVQPAGRRSMPATAWARGARLQPGERLGLV
jgi:methionyl-tRNA formyltransferase